jgi:hypothetical protein
VAEPCWDIEALAFQAEGAVASALAALDPKTEGTAQGLTVRSSKVFLLGDRSEGQLPFAARIRLRGHTDAIIDRCQAWIAEHYEVANPVARMADGQRPIKGRSPDEYGS